jgi:hypothetical protein
MPTHALAGHLAIITASLTVVLALVYALRPDARRGMRMPLLVGVVLNACMTIWATLAGGDLYDQFQAANADVQALTTPHAEQGDWLAVASLVLAILVTVMAFRRLSPQRPTSGAAHAVAASALIVNALVVAWYLATTPGLAMQSVWSHHQIWGG